MGRPATRSKANDQRRDARRRTKPSTGAQSFRIDPAELEGGARRMPVKAREINLQPLTQAQDAYDRSIANNIVTFGIGPAGTGKTWWAAQRAAEAFLNGDITRIIVTRPAVEAGEKMGFLPGELEEKYEPYFRPVRDALEERFGSGHLEYLIKAGAIEARPLNFIRGSTLKDCWVIADEMQNATVTEMKLLLSRIGENAKFLVNGDPDQCDLPGHVQSGLADAVRRLKGQVGKLEVVEFTTDDIVRSGICQEIVVAYGRNRPDSSRYNESLKAEAANDDAATGDLFEHETSGLGRFLKVA